MISVGFQRVRRNVPVGFVANRLIVAFRRTKVLPSACVSVRELADGLATVETYKALLDSIHHHSTKN